MNNKFEFSPYLHFSDEVGESGGVIYPAHAKENEQRSENKWNDLSKEDQLDYFCAVVRRIHQGELVDSRSYRGVLYGIFGFGPEAYAKAQEAGFLDLHNQIYAYDYEKRLLGALLRKEGVADEEIEGKVESFLRGEYA